MKKVMLIALMGLFSTVMFAQNKKDAKPAETKNQPAKTEVSKPPAQESPKTTAKPVEKQTNKKEHPKHLKK